MQDIKPSIIAFNIIEGIEQFRGLPYQRKGDVPTIGYGTTHYPNGIAVTLRDHPVSVTTAHGYVVYFCEQVCKDLSKLITQTINQNKIDALTCIVYNIGITEFRASTLLKEININPNNFDEIEIQWKRWIYSDHVISNGLVDRRNKEFLLYSKSIS